MPQPKVVEKGEGVFLKTPGKCLVSQRADVPLIDFGVDHTGMDPHIYIAVGQVVKAAKVLGMAEEKDFLELREQADELLIENRELEAKLKVKPLLEDLMAVAALRELAFTAAGAATAPLLEDHPDYDFSQATERITERVETVLSDFLTPKEEDKT